MFLPLRAPWTGQKSREPVASDLNPKLFRKGF